MEDQFHASYSIPLIHVLLLFVRFVFLNYDTTTVIIFWFHSAPILQPTNHSFVASN